MTSKLFLILSVALVIALLGYVYVDSLTFLFGHWIGSEDYSHGVFVPLISIFLAWQARYRIAGAERGNSWWGIAVIAAGLLLYVIGELATLYVVSHLSLWLLIVGLVITLIGACGAKAVGFPLFYLLTAIPLPVFFYASLSSQLQLMSSAMGVGCLQLVGVTAFRDGNVIDLGPVQLQVVEACSGIRYLLPLTSLALLCAYLFKDKMWKRILLVLSSIPISILVNGFRIGMIGVLVELYGQGAAEGFYHLFEGWVLFMTSLGLLILEMWVLTKIGAKGSRESFLDRFSWIETETRTLEVRGVRSEATASNFNPPTSNRLFPGPAYLCGVALLVPFALASSVITEREELPPPRNAFVDFPMTLNRWQGTPLALEKQYIDALRFDDYVLADYRFKQSQPVSFYVAYYRSQKKGQSAHSPQSCLPGGGWEISSLTPMELAPPSAMIQPLRANRVLIQKADQKQIVLYWFKQRERILTDEYLVKLYLLWDAISRRRTDGALVRIASPVGPGETETEVDQRLRDFATVVEPELTRYVPD